MGKPGEPQHSKSPKPKPGDSSKDDSGAKDGHNNPQQQLQKEKELQAQGLKSPDVNKDGGATQNALGQDVNNNKDGRSKSKQHRSSSGTHKSSRSSSTDKSKESANNPSTSSDGEGDVMNMLVTNMTHALTAMSKNFVELKTSIGTGFDRMTNVMQDANQEWQEFPEDGYDHDEGEASGSEYEEETEPPVLKKMRLDGGSHDISDSDNDVDQAQPGTSATALKKLLADSATKKVTTGHGNEDRASKVGSLLSSLKKQVEAEEETAGDISANLAEIVQTMYKNGLSEAEAKEKSDKHLRPKNCDMLSTTKVNQMLWDKLPAATRSADLKMQNIQKLLVKGVVPLVKLADTLLKVMLGKQDMPPEQELFEQLTDSVGLMATANYTLNMRRRELIIPEMNADFQGLKSKNVPLSTHLFGDELEKTLEDISKANRVSKKVEKKRKPEYGGYQQRRGYHHQRGGYKAQNQQGRGQFQYRRGGPFLGQQGQRRGKPPYRKQEGDRKKHD